MGTLNVDQLRIQLLEASRHAATDQHNLFVTNGTITLEYALLGNLGDLLSAAAMLTHTIDRAHTEPTAHPAPGQRTLTAEQVRELLTSDDTFLGSTS